MFTFRSIWCLDANHFNCLTFLSISERNSFKIRKQKTDNANGTQQSHSPQSPLYLQK